MSQKIVPVPKSEQVESHCRYCDEVISDSAKVCRHCGRSQNRLINLMRHSDLISIVLFVIAIWQFTSALQERANADVAFQKALSAEARVSEAKRDIFDVSEAVLSISEIVARSTGYGSGLSESDRVNLKRHSDFLKLRLHQFDKSKQ